MAILVLLVAVAAFVGVLWQARSGVHSRAAERYAVSTGSVRRLIRSQHPPSWGLSNYRWKSGRTDNEYFGRVVVTQDAVYLTPSMVGIPLLGMYFVIRSYRVPRDEIVCVIVQPEQQPPRWSWLLRRTRSELLLSTSQATCELKGATDVLAAVGHAMQS